MDIICLGELLIDFISIDRDASLIESSGFVKAPGGAPANVAVGAAKLGIAAGFIGKVGNDPFGYYLKKVLEDNKVDTGNLIFDHHARTTLSFIAQRSDGVRDCMFYRNPGADMLLSPEEIDEKYFKGAGIFHFGSISLGSPKSEAATLKAIEYARKNNMIISYDPNLRLSLWEDETLAREKINEGFKYADIVKISDEEYGFITGKTNHEDCAEYILSKGCKVVLVTLGANGCYYSDGKISGSIPGLKVNVVETTGAGDAFVAAMLYKIIGRMKENRETALNIDESFIKAVEFANCSGALATTKMGAIPALPTVDEVLKVWKG